MTSSYAGGGVCIALINLIRVEKRVKGNDIACSWMPSVPVKIFTGKNFDESKIYSSHIVR